MYKIVQIICFTKVFYVTAFGFVGCILFIDISKPCHIERRAKFASQGAPRWMNSPQARSEELEREKRDLMAESADSPVDHDHDSSL